MRWWENQPLRIIEICDCFDLKRLSCEEIAKTVKKLGGNAQHFHCMEMSTKQYGPGLDDRSLYFKTSVSFKQNPDRLAQYIPYAKKYGIRIIVYFNVHWYTTAFGNRHPDWMQIKEDGSEIKDVYGTGTSFCINSPYREWVFQVLKDLCKYEIDGIFYDGPIFFSNTCYCSYCQKLFYEKTGKNPPPKSNRNHPLWVQFTEFQAQSMENFLKESNRIIKSANPDMLFYINGNSNWPYWPTGRDNHCIIKHTDILAAEGGFLYGDLNQTPLFKPAITGKLLSSQAEKKPTVVFDCAGHKPWSWYMLPETEISILLYETCFSGSNFWIALFPDDINQPEAKTIAKFNNFIEKHPDAFYKTESLSKIALVWPAKSAELYTGSSVPLTDFTSQIKGEEIGNLNKEFNGFYQILSKIQVPFDVIDEYNFGSLEKYDIVILPNAACLSDQDCEKIREFAHKGGSIIASFETSLYNEKGQRKKNFGLSKVFGIRFAGNIIGHMQYDYITPVRNNKNFYLKGIKKGFLPAPEYGIFVETTTGHKEILFCKKLAGRYDGIPEFSDNPMMIVNNYGKGASIYFAGNFGATVSNFGFIEYFTLMKNICENLAESPVSIEGEKNIEVFLRRKGKNAFLYLINLTGGSKRPLDSLEPIYNIKIFVKGIKPKSIKALKSDRLLKYRETNKGIEFIISEIRDFEIIEFQTGEKNGKGLFCAWCGL
ncbi:MAG: family 10 glycosylhydrolase [Candidatus Omnitrophica bacterium]|nr:family 10 glycosylhydrolase [Candidatus Omnitrophota bacterium]MCM8828225.1 family 10 glycosylhydrolase [Candidatus Omnitrophota bacterium]